MTRRLNAISRLRYPLVAVAAALVLVIGYAAFTAARNLGTGAAPSRGGATATNAMGPVGFKVKVDQVQRSDGEIIVTLTFENTSDSQQRADPADFRLKVSGREVTPSFGATCSNWGRVDLYPPSGSNEPLRDPNGTKAPATWGPATLCFADSAAPSDLVLVWSPDVAFGPLSGTSEIDLGRY